MFHMMYCILTRIQWETHSHVARGTKGKEELEVSGGEWPSLTDGLDLAETMKELSTFNF